MYMLQKYCKDNFKK